MDRFWLTDEHMDRITPCFSRSHGRPRVDDRRVLSGIIHVLEHGDRWRDSPECYGLRTLCNRFARWSQLGVFDRSFAELAADAPSPNELLIDSSHVNRRSALAKGGLNSKLYAVTDRAGRPLVLLLTEGQIADRIGAHAMLDAQPPTAASLIGDKGYDTDRLCADLTERDIGSVHRAARRAKASGGLLHPCLQTAQRHRPVLVALKTGDASTPATTSAQTCS